MYSAACYSEMTRLNEVARFAELHDCAIPSRTLRRRNRHVCNISLFTLRRLHACRRNAMSAPPPPSSAPPGPSDPMPPPAPGSSVAGNAAGAKRRRRHHHQPQVHQQLAPPPSIFTGVGSTVEDKDSELLCPICFELLDEAHMTPCGHTFCHACVTKALSQSLRCPKCSFRLESAGPDSLFPNFSLNELASKARRRRRQDRDDELGGGPATSSPAAPLLRQLLARHAPSLGLDEVEFMLTRLSRKRDELQAESYVSQRMLLKEFLAHLKKQKDNELFQLRKESAVIARDLDSVEADIDAFFAKSKSVSSTATRESPEDSASVVPAAATETVEGFNVGSDLLALQKSQESNLKHRRRRMHAHFEDLSECYFTSRTSDILFPPKEEEDSTCKSGGGKPNSDEEDDDAITQEGLNSFSRCLSKFTRYSSVRPLATLSYTADIFNNASIVSSIEFDKDNEFFAIAGVTKRIKVYDYNVVLKDMVDIHYPSMEMTCGSKISSVAWSSFQKSALASSDYEGTVILWDASTCQRTRVFQEHEKRCWSVDFNMVDTKLLASGSDDARVKLWSTNVSRSVASLEAKANVCCVKFNPASCYHLAFGSADHCVHYYDLRSTKAPLALFRGHRKVGRRHYRDGRQLTPPHKSA